jgi:hypothetical protein
MRESDRRFGTNIFYRWIQEDLLNKFYNINGQDTKTLEVLGSNRKMTSEMEQAMIAYLEVDDTTTMGR